MESPMKEENVKLLDFNLIVQEFADIECINYIANRI